MTNVEGVSHLPITSRLIRLIRLIRLVRLVDIIDAPPPKRERTDSFHNSDVRVATEEEEAYLGTCFFFLFPCRPLASS